MMCWSPSLRFATQLANCASKTEPPELCERPKSKMRMEVFRAANNVQCERHVQVAVSMANV
jgi:hypothetical protein